MSSPVTDAARLRFERLYGETRVAILGYLLRRCDDPGDAADLMGETYLTAWRRIEDVPEGDGARLWLYGVARRMLANHRRHRLVDRRLTNTLRADLISELDRTGFTGTGEFSGVIAGCVAKLSAADRELIELSAYEQLTPTEIAIVVGKSAGAIRVRVHRVRMALRAELTGAGFPTAQRR